MEFLNKDCQGIVLQSGQGEYKVIGRLNNISKKNTKPKINVYSCKFSNLFNRLYRFRITLSK